MINGLCTHQRRMSARSLTGRRLCVRLACLTMLMLLVGPDSLAQAGEMTENEMQALLGQTRERSLTLRDRSLRKAIAGDSCWPHGVWGDTLWALAALHLDEKTEAANRKLRQHAREYLEKTTPSTTVDFRPETAKETPWAYFALVDYVRILCLFSQRSEHFPGRLHAGTEADMKAALWHWLKAASRVADAAEDQLLALQGTENHDLTKRPACYLMAAVLRDDPDYRMRKYDDGHTPDEHFAAYNAYFREWPRLRAKHGLWVELGSNTYQKYSWPALFNLRDLAPDPIVRKRVEMLLDVALVEEAQVSVLGLRGGGRSRASFGGNNFESYKNLLYADAGLPAGSTHSRVIETSSYQAPAAAVLLRRRLLPPAQPFLIVNRVLGELAPAESHAGEGPRLARDSALVNYVYRTPRYLLGCTLQDPSLRMHDPKTNQETLRYAAISRQQRWCGMLFQPGTPLAEDSIRPAEHRLQAIFPVIHNTRGGRPQHSYWTAQHRNMMVLQRIPPQKPEHPMRLGSYSTGTISMQFHGKDLQRVEENGWIFASDGQAFAAVKIVDHDHEWDEARQIATPIGCERFTCACRTILQAGDTESHGNFTEFRRAVLANQLQVHNDTLEYRFGPRQTLLSWTRYNPDDPEAYRLPAIDGKPLTIRPQWTYRGPHLQGPIDRDRIRVTAGPLRWIYDFETCTISMEAHKDP